MMRRIWIDPIIFGLVLLVALGLIFYLLLGRGVVDTLVEQMQHRELAVARMGAASVTAFLDLAGKSVVVVAGNPGGLQAFADQWQGTPLVGTILTDVSGQVVAGANQAEAPVDLISVADRNYFMWAKTAGAGAVEVFGPVLSRTGQSKGKYVVIVATPQMDRQGKFKGVLAAAVMLSKLTEQYLDPLRFSEQMGVHVVTDEGLVVYSSTGPKAGENVVEYVKKQQFLGSKVLAQRAAEGLKKGEEGKLDLAWPGEKGWQRYLVAYSPIKIEEGRYWYLVLTMPVDDALAFVGPLYMRVLVTFTAVFLAFLAYAVRLARHFASEERRKYEHEKHGIKE